MSKHRKARKHQQAAALQAQKAKQMKDPKGTSAYAKKKKKGISPSSPFYTEPRPLPVATPATASRKSWWRRNESTGIGFTSIYGR